jgi:hypothetical protein
MVRIDSLLYFALQSTLHLLMDQARRIMAREVLMVRTFILLLLALAPAAAAAGTRATFIDRLGTRQTIVIADNGDLDVELHTGRHLIVSGGRAYVVEERLTGPLVTALDEVEAAGAARAATAQPPPSPELQAAIDTATADLEATADDMMLPDDEPVEPAGSQPRPDRPALVRRDAVEVNGRTGRGYYYEGGVGGRTELFAVISDDPALAPVGAAFRHGLDAGKVLQRLTWDSPSPPPEMDAAWRAILESGTPIQYYDARLREVERVAIPSIPLPAEPETGAAMRARLADEAAARDAPPAPEWMASRAIFAGGRLYLVAGNHRLLSLAEGERSLTRHDLGEPVLDACVRGGEPIALTGAVQRAQSWTLRRFHGGQWETERAIVRDDDEPVALACTPDGAFLLTSKRFIDLTRADPAVLALRGEPIQALVTAAVHVTPEAVFVGLNAGEWGGGLRRIDRRSGQVALIERNETGALCDGPLNTACDPVQGLATIPWRPTCVAAAIGLIHMMAHGRLTMVCPDRTEQLYAAADRAFEDPERAREAARGGYGAVAFFGLAARGNSLIAIGHNGLYRLASDGTATHVPLPRFTRVDGMLVSFALPDVVLVVTGINGRAAMSGAVPIMAVR